MKNIILLFGGKSCEHDISIITAMQVKENLVNEKYFVFPIYITKENEWYLLKKETKPQDFVDFSTLNHTQVFLKNGENSLFFQKKNKIKPICEIDCAVVCCHGLNGEDGTLQGQLELCGIPYTSSGVVSSAVCMDKVFMKEIFEVNNLPVTNYRVFQKENFIKQEKKVLQSIKKELELPVVVKPANLGSSIGINVCKNQTELTDALNVAFQFDKKILVEEAVLHLREINCACFCDNGKIVVSDLDEPAKWTEFFDFPQKYLAKNLKALKTKPKQPLPKYIKDLIKDISKTAYMAFDCFGVVRIDFLYNNDTEELFISEINSIPGSFAHFMFDGLTFSNLIDKLIENAIARKNYQEGFKFSYSSTVLNQETQNKF